MQVAKHFGASGSPRSLHSTSEAHRAVRRRRRWPNIEGGGAVSAGCVWKAQAYYNAKAAGALRATDSLTRSARSAGSGCLRAYARTRAGLPGPGSPSSRNLARVGYAFDQRAGGSGRGVLYVRALALMVLLICSRVSAKANFAPTYLNKNLFLFSRAHATEHICSLGRQRERRVLTRATFARPRENTLKDLYIYIYIFIYIYIYTRVSARESFNLLVECLLSRVRATEPFLFEFSRVSARVL